MMQGVLCKGEDGSEALKAFDAEPVEVLAAGGVVLCILYDCETPHV